MRMLAIHRMADTSLFCARMREVIPIIIEMQPNDATIKNSSVGTIKEVAAPSQMQNGISEKQKSALYKGSKRWAFSFSL